MRETIREYSGKIIGYIEYLPNGDKRAINFSGKILGTYRKAQNQTVDFYGKILYIGDMTAALLVTNN